MSSEETCDNEYLIGRSKDDDNDPAVNPNDDQQQTSRQTEGGDGGFFVETTDGLPNKSRTPGGKTELPLKKPTGTSESVPSSIPTRLLVLLTFLLFLLFGVVIIAMRM
jgi:hypothetical protein